VAGGSRGTGIVHSGRTRGVSCSGWCGRTVRCLDAATGTPKWNLLTGDAVKSSMAIWGDKTVFGSNDGCVYCINVADGTMVWKYQTGGIVLARRP